MRSELEKLRSAVVSAQQATIFGGGQNKVIDACIDYLKYQGYRVLQPPKFDKTINTTRDLVEYFYSLLNSRKPENYATSYNEMRDMAVAKRFVDARMQVTGANKAYTLNECGEIIRTIFDNYDEFGFKYDINFSIFGQGNLKWVTDKAIQIMNKKLQEKEEEHAEVLRQKALESYDEPSRFSSLDDILKRMEEDADA